MRQRREPDPDWVDCRDCGEAFRLDQVGYYDNQCPSCRSEPASRTCLVCSDEFVEPDGRSATVRGPTGRRELVTVCSDGCRTALCSELAIQG